MADSTWTMTGRNELVAAVQQLPDVVTAKLRAVAAATAQRVLQNARANLGAETHGTGYLASTLGVTEDLPNKQFIVGPSADLARKHPWNLQIWLEYGTVHMPARPYMHPAAQREQAQYVTDCEAAATVAATEALG